jgi:hypothetical protein
MGVFSFTTRRIPRPGAVVIGKKFVEATGCFGRGLVNPMSTAAAKTLAMTRVLSIAGIAMLAAVALAGCRGPGEQDPADAPDQPIAFFHSVHAGQNHIP